MAQKSSREQDETLTEFKDYFINVIHENKEKSDLLETLRKELQDMEIKEAQHDKQDEALKAELKKAKEINADMASMNATWTQEKKRLNEELARIQTTHNLMSAVNAAFRVTNDQLKSEITRLENEKKLAEQNLRTKEIKKLTLKSKLNQLKMNFEQIQERMKTTEADAKKVRQMAGGFTMKAKKQAMDCAEVMSQYRRVRNEVDNLMKQIELAKQGESVKPCSDMRSSYDDTNNVRESMCDIDAEQEDETRLIDTLMDLKTQNAKTLQEIIDLESSMAI